MDVYTQYVQDKTSDARQKNGTFIHKSFTSFVIYQGRGNFHSN